MLLVLMSELCSLSQSSCLVLSLPTNGRNATKALYCRYLQPVATVQTSRSVT